MTNDTSDHWAAQSWPLADVANHLEPWCRTRTMPKGMLILGQGDEHQDVWLIRSGVTKYVYSSTNGRKIIICVRQGLHILGLASLIGNRFSPVSVTTVTEIVVASLSADKVKEILHNDSRLAALACAALAIETDLLLDLIGNRSSLSARDRLLWFLRDLAGEGLPRERLAPLPRPRVLLHAWELAQLVGVSPTHLSRLVSGLEKESLVRREAGRQSFGIDLTSEGQWANHLANSCQRADPERRDTLRRILPLSRYPSQALYVVVDLRGGLGNQLFQDAIGTTIRVQAGAIRRCERWTAGTAYAGNDFKVIRPGSDNAARSALRRPRRTIVSRY